MHLQNAASAHYVNISAEVNLWRFVIILAIEDAIKSSRPQSKSAEDDLHPNNKALEGDYDDAYIWFKNSGKDYLRVCAFAEIDPVWLQKTVLQKCQDIAENKKVKSPKHRKREKDTSYNDIMNY